MKSRTNNIERTQEASAVKRKWCILECSRPGLRGTLTVREKLAAIPLGIRDLDHKDNDHLFAYTTHRVLLHERWASVGDILGLGQLCKNMLVMGEAVYV